MREAVAGDVAPDYVLPEARIRDRLWLIVTLLQNKAALDQRIKEKCRKLLKTR